MRDIPIPNNRVALGGTIGGLVVAMRHSLIRLAMAHGNKAGPWLDELQLLIESEIKGSSCDDLSYEAQAEYVTAALAIVSGLFADVRSELGGG